MYLLWALYAWGLLARLVMAFRTWRLIVWLGWTVNGAILLAGIAGGLASGRLTWLWTERYTFVFSLMPYAFALEVVALHGLALAETAASRRARILYRLGSLAAAGLLLAAQARGSLLFLALTAAILAAARRGPWRGRVALGAVAAMLALLGGLLLFGVGPGDLDAFASGRLSLFSVEIAEHLPGDSTLDWLVGSASFAGGERTLATTDKISEEARFARRNTDNTYLALVLNHGLVGLALFLAPAFWVWRRLSRLERSARGPARRMLQLGLATMIGLAAQSVVSLTVPSMGNLVAIYLPLYWLPLARLDAGAERAREA
jgi:hypothetical protein